jgi:hypothetical protein
MKALTKVLGPVRGQLQSEPFPSLVLPKTSGVGKVSSQSWRTAKCNHFPLPHGKITMLTERGAKRRGKLCLKVQFLQKGDKYDFYIKFPFLMLTDHIEEKITMGALRNTSANF